MFAICLETYNIIISVPFVFIVLAFLVFDSVKFVFVKSDSLLHRKTLLNALQVQGWWTNVN